MNELGAKFTSDPVGSFPFPKGKVIELSSALSANVAFRTVMSHNITSAPVWDSSLNEYVGFFDVQDAIDLAIHSESHGHYTVGELVKMEHLKNPLTAPWCPVDEMTSMREVIGLLCSVRRVPVIDSKTKKIVMVVSQSLIVAQLAEALAGMKETPSRFLCTPRGSGIALKTVVTVPEETSAKEAFQILYEKNLSALGVVDEEGALLACITAKDIRLLPVVDMEETKGDHVAEELLALSAMDFVVKARLAYEKRGKGRPAAVVVHIDTPFNQMISKLAKTSLHRLFLVDHEHKPCGVFSVGDVVRLLV